MRILFLAPHPFFQHRGTPLAERSLLEVVTAEGHEVEVVTFAEGEDLDLPGCHLVRTLDLRWLRGIRPGFSLKKLVADLALLWRSVLQARRWRPDLVHAVEESAFIGLVIKTLFGVPYVYDMDSSLAEQLLERYRWLRFFRRPLEAAEGLAIRHSLAVVAVCPALADLVREHGAQGLTACIEDATLLHSAAGDRPTSQVAHSQDAAVVPTVTYVGNLEPYQGIDLLLESMAWALSHGAKARLVIVGGVDDDVARYRNRSRTLGIEASVDFVGRRPVSELGEWLSRADVLVSPRLGGRNTPMKIYSYLDARRPIVATRVLTHTQVLDDTTAILAEPNAQAFGAALRRALDEPDAAAAIADRARALARERFTPDKTADKVRALYRALSTLVVGRATS